MPPGWQPFSGVQIVNKGVKVAVLLWRGRKLKGRWLTYSQGFFFWVGQADGGSSSRAAVNGSGRG